MTVSYESSQGICSFSTTSHQIVTLVATERHAETGNKRITVTIVV